MAAPRTHARSGITVADILKGGFSTPWDAPTIPTFPFAFRDVDVLTLTYRTDREAVAAVLPPPLEPTGDAVLIHIYRMNDTDWLGPYGESNIMVGARLPGSGLEGAYSPYLFLSSGAGVAHGREVHGQPKKLGNPRIEARGDAWVATIARNGIDIVTGTLAYKQRRDEIARLADIMPFAVNLNLKAVDHIDGTPAIRQITSRRLAEVNVRECWSGPCTVELRANIQAPVYRLPVRAMLDGFYWRADFTLEPGEVVYDYLAEARKGVARKGEG